MRFEKVHLDAIGYELAPVVVSSASLEQRLASVYETLRIQPGQLEALTGIRERRFWEPGFKMAEGALRAGRHALGRAGLVGADLGALIYTGVCRDGFEPATACEVAHRLGVSPNTFVADVSNACLGVLNGIFLVANMIELGQIRAGLVVSCESAREIVEQTMVRMQSEPTMERLRLSLATMTGGSGAVAMLLTDGTFARHNGRHRLVGGVTRAAPEFHHLCYWGPGPDGLPHMYTDAAEIMRRGVTLGALTWKATLETLAWKSEDVSKVICHQVGGSHRGAILEALGIPPIKEFPTYEYLGNMGTVSLPLTAAVATERGFLQSGDRVGFLGIGSGLNCLMMGWEW